MNTDTIKDLELEMVDIGLEITNVDTESTSIKKRCIRVIEEEYNSTKSKDLSNASKRNDAVEEIISRDAKYIELINKVDELKIKLKLIRIDRDFETREFQREIYLNKQM